MGYVENVRRRRRRRLVAAALVGTSVLTSGTCWAATSADGSGGSTWSQVDQLLSLDRLPGFAAVPDSNHLDAPTLLAGRLLGSGGAALPDASVVVSAWPSNETAHRLPLGGEFDLIPVARTTSDGAGRYRLKAVPAAALAALTGENGLDLQLDVFRQGRHWTWLTQVVPSHAGWARASAGALDAVPAATRDTLDLALDPAAGERVLSALPTGGRLTAADHPFPGHWCTRFKKLDTKVVPQTVATAISRNGAIGHVTYTSEARTESSAGVSYNNGVSFGVSGSRTRVSHLEAEWSPIASGPGQSVARDYVVGWEHNVMRQECLTDFAGHWKYGPQIVTSADRASGYALDPDSRFPVDWDCKDIQRSAPASASVSTDSERAYTYQRDFSFAPLGLGNLTGNTTSGYSSEVKITFSFEHGHPGVWCGNSGFPTAPGQRVQGVVQ